jgi:hypothetical protein
MESAVVDHPAATAPSSARPTLRRIGLVALLVLALLPAVLPLVLIHRDGVDVLYYDQWDMVPTVLDAHNGKIPEKLFAQHNEHRVVIPRLIYMVLDNLTHWRVIDELLTTFAIVCITSVGVLWLCHATATRDPLNADDSRNDPRRTAKLLGLWFVCNTLIFSPMQYENWLWGIGVMNVLPMMFIVAALIVFTSRRLPPWPKMILCILLATSATFSSGNGMLAWPLLGALWVWSRSWAALKQKRWLLLAWVLGAIVNVVLYFRHYQTPEHAKIAYQITTGTVVQYILAFLGAPLGFGTAMPAVLACTIAGALLLFLLVAVMGLMTWSWRMQRHDYELSARLLLWLVFAGFAVASAVLAGVTRAGFGVQQALSSRYLTFSVYLPIALLSMLFILAQQSRGRSGGGAGRIFGITNTALITIILLLQATTIIPAFRYGESTRTERLEAKAALLMINIVPPNERTAQVLFPKPTLRAEANELNELGWIRPSLVTTSHARDIRAPEDSAYPSTSYGHFEQFGRQSPDRMAAVGWAVSPDKGSAADAVFLTWDRINNDPVIFAMATMGLQREDIAQSQNQPGYANCGWFASFPTSRLPPGNDWLRIRAWSFNVKTGTAIELHGDATLQR